MNVTVKLVGHPKHIQQMIASCPWVNRQNVDIVWPVCRCNDLAQDHNENFECLVPGCSCKLYEPRKASR